MNDDLELRLRRSLADRAAATPVHPDVDDVHRRVALAPTGAAHPAVRRAMAVAAAVVIGVLAGGSAEARPLVPAAASATVAATDR